MAQPTSDAIRDAIHAELSPLRQDLAALRDAVTGKDGLLVSTAVLTSRVERLEESVRLGTPVDPKRRGSDSSDQGALTLRASPAALAKLIGTLLGGVATGGGVVWWLAPFVSSSPLVQPPPPTPPAHVTPAPSPRPTPSPLLPAAIIPGVTDAPEPEPSTEAPRDVRRPAPPRSPADLQETR